MEFRLFSTTKSVVTIVIGGVILYAILYNFMYMDEVVRQVPVAVVDEENTAQSRTLVRQLDATPQLHVTHRPANVEVAKETLDRGEVEGVICLPRDAAPIYIMWGSTASLLTYSAIQEAVTAVSMARLSEAAAMSGKGSRAAVDIVGLPLYNATGGYGTYLIPAVLMVILFQTLLMAVSVRLGTDYTERYRRWLHLISVPTWHSAARLVTARLLVYVSVYAVMAFFLVGLVPWLFDLPHESGPLTLAVLMGEYLVASAAFALACAPLFRDPEGPLVYIAFFSVGYLFLSGISYPLELMPAGWRIVRLFFPVCPATLAYVETATMGATLQDISAHLLLLSVQAKVYISVAVFGHFRLLKRGFHYGILKNNDEKQINS
jgi:hypothetical protein